MESAHGIFHTDCDCCNADLSPAKSGDQFAIDDLLNFPNDVDTTDGLEAAMKGTSAASSSVSFPVVVNATDSHFPPADIGGPGHFAGELCVPHEVLPDLEWLSNFVDESFSNEDLQMLQGIKARTDHISSTNLPQFQPESTAKGPLPRRKSRSKRSRSVPGKRTSRVVVSPTLPTAKKVVKPAAQKDRHDGSNGRKCLHCATDKTPQWRTGPLGPKTLCNACGVRFKSGRLVPEYRPASSPTFVLTKHSNSHRKVLELRRQKEMQKAQMQPAAPPYLPHHHHHNVMFDECDDGDCLIQQYIRPDYS